LKERSLEVIRMYKALLETRASENEDTFTPLFEEPSFITLGAAYLTRPRLAGGAYNPIVKRTEGFLELPLSEAIEIRESRAELLIELDDEVSRIVDGLKGRGLVSPYLKNFVVARLNYLRFKKEAPEYEEALEKMIDMAKRFDIGRVSKEDVAKAGGGPVEAEA
jgi:ParB family transcriptional regulator, chromosome partitioning protein